MKVNGWSLFAHPAFLGPFNKLVDDVGRLSDEVCFHHPKAKLLRRVLDLVVQEIPADPASPVFLLGNTLGPDARHWCRAKFLGRFRLFYRFDSASHIIIFAWINDENSLRQAGGRNDPYTVFARKLRAGDPPTDWDDLVRTTAPFNPP